jgi:hypothetical protein
MTSTNPTQQLAFCTHRRGQLTKKLSEFAKYANDQIDALSAQRQANETRGEMSQLDKMMFDNIYKKLTSLLDMNPDDFKHCVEFEDTANAWVIASLMKVNEEGGEVIEEMTAADKTAAIEKYTADGKEESAFNKTTGDLLDEMVKYRDMIPLLDDKIVNLNKEVLTMKVRAGRGSGKAGQRSSPKNR